MKEKRCSFRNKILVLLGLFSVLLTLVICLAVGLYYWETQMSQYSTLAYNYAKTAAEYIDGDTVLGYLETNEKDEYYEQVMDFMNCTLAQTDLFYYYVFVPYEDDLAYVWDAGDEGDVYQLGYQEAYMEGGKEASYQAMLGDVPDDMYLTNDEKYGYIGSVYYPIYDSAGESVALVGVDLTVSYMYSNLRNFFGVIALGIVVVVCAFIILLYRIFNRSFIAPIDKLNVATKKMVSNLGTDTEVTLDIHTRDEIEELADSFTHMNAEVKDYIAKLTRITMEKERIAVELDVATHIQASMLPCIFPAFPGRSEFDIYATMTPAKEVGGDFYDFFLIDDNHLAMVMADVSGKGVPAALFMMISKTLLKSVTQTGLSPADVLETVNNQLCENNEVDMFVTVWLGILEISTGKMICANAGHEYPAIKRANSAFELYEDKHGFVLAGMDNMKYKEYELTLAKGDVIFVYTDGVPEATNSKEELYGMDRMLRALNQKKDVGCKQVLDIVYQDVGEFVGQAPQFDDITMLCLKFGESVDELL